MLIGLKIVFPTNNQIDWHKKWTNLTSLYNEKPLLYFEISLFQIFQNEFDQSIK